MGHGGLRKLRAGLRVGGVPWSEGRGLWAVLEGKATWWVLGKRICFGRLWKVPVLGWGLQRGRSCSSDPLAPKPLGG